METANTAPALDRLVGPLGECLTAESARRRLALKADPKLQARVDYLAGRFNQGLLTPEERAEYGDYVTFGTFVAILKSEARQLLANSQCINEPSRVMLRENLLFSRHQDGLVEATLKQTRGSP